MNLLDRFPLTLSEEATAVLKTEPVIIISVSGGKDGAAAAILVNTHLDALGHPKHLRYLIQADLGKIEWEDSLPSAQRLADLLQLPLLIVKRAAGGMVERWYTGWISAQRRYRELLCVTLPSPWSSAASRFCTGELKRDPIAKELRTRFSNTNLISIQGIRRQESSFRAKAPVFVHEKRFSRPSTKLMSYKWNPILDLSREDTFEIHDLVGLKMHEAYELGNERVSCAFCVLAALNDLKVASRQPKLNSVFHELIDLEIESTFSFQPSRWLGDVAPQQLSPEKLLRLRQSQLKAASRRELEKDIPKHLRIGRGATEITIPTYTEALHLAEVRRGVFQLFGWEPTFIDADEIREHYERLQAQVLKRHPIKK